MQLNNFRFPSLKKVSGLVFIFWCAVALTFAQAQTPDGNTRPKHIFMAGNSTMANKPYRGSNPEKGWGQVLGLYFNEQVKVENHAVNGQSSKSFIDEGKWDNLLQQVQEGDYVIIEFGHNDEKKENPSRYAAPDGAYRQNLKRFVSDVRTKGGIPVLATPIVRRRFDESGQFYDTHGRYPDVVREVAAEEEVHLLDLNRTNRELLITYGAERTRLDGRSAVKGKKE